MMWARTLASMLRIGSYSGAGLFFFIADPDTRRAAEAFFLGAMLADYVTWLTWTIMMFPRFIWHCTVDVAVNLAFAVLFLHFVHFEFSMEGEDIASAFVAFLLVMALKMGYYGMHELTEDEDED